MKLEFKKIINENDEKMYLLKSVTGMLGKDQLPNRYFTKPCHCYYIDTGFTVTNTGLFGRQYIEIGRAINPKGFENILLTLKKAKASLTESKKERAALEREWSGPVIVVI